MSPIDEDVEGGMSDPESPNVEEFSPAYLREMEQACRAEALIAEQAAILAMEAAMTARAAADSQSAVLDKARADANAAALKATRTVAAAERAAESSKAAEEAVEQARLAVLPVAKVREEAEEIVSNGAKAEAMAAEKLLDARMNEKSASLAVTAAEKLAQTKMEAATIEGQTVKLAKKEADKAMAVAAESAQAAKQCIQVIVDAQGVFDEKQEAAEEAAKKAHQLREDLEDKTQSHEVAERAAQEAVGGDSAWEAKTAEKLKAREVELKKATTASTKATRIESLAEAAEYEAGEKLKQAKEDKAAKDAEAEQDEKSSQEASAHVQKLNRSWELAQQVLADAEKSAVDARSHLATMTMKVEEAERAQQDAAPERAEKAAHAARQEEAKAKKHERDMIAAAAAQRQALATAISEKEAAAANAQLKHELAEKAAQKDYTAQEKERDVEALVDKLQAKVVVLALAKLKTRGIQMSATQAADSAEGSRMSREMTINWNKPPKEVSIVDMWNGWRYRRDDGGVWNPRRLFFDNSGTMFSTLDVLVSDIVGSALDLGPICGRRCKITGDGIAQASIAQMSTFTIAAFNVEGKPFDIGGANFVVSVRFAGMGTRVKSKVHSSHRARIFAPHQRHVRHVLS